VRLKFGARRFATVVLRGFRSWVTAAFERVLYQAIPKYLWCILTSFQIHLRTTSAVLHLPAAEVRHWLCCFSMRGSGGRLQPSTDSFLVKCLLGCVELGVAYALNVRNRQKNQEQGNAHNNNRASVAEYGHHHRRVYDTCETVSKKQATECMAAALRSKYNGKERIRSTKRADVGP